METKGYVRINGIKYECHEEIEKLFVTLHQNQLSSAEEREGLQAQIQQLNHSLENLSQQLLKARILSINTDDTHNGKSS